MKDKKIELKKQIEEAMGVEIELIDENDKFDFKCTACGKCCANDSVDMILLTPFDLYNLSKGTGENIEDIVNKYTNVYIGKNSNLPVVQLNSVFDPQKSIENGMDYNVCPFLKDNKCSVHDFKPSICRLYPLGRTTTISTNDNERVMTYFLLKNNCGGKGELHSLDNWIKNRSDYDRLQSEYSAFFSTIISIVDFAKLQELSQKDKSISRVLDSMYNFMINEYYLNYDTNRPFWEQYERNKEEILLKFKFIKMAIDAYLK